MKIRQKRKAVLRREARIRNWELLKDKVGYNSGKMPNLLGYDG